MADQNPPLRPPPEDPNRTQNRVPSQRELVTIRNIRSNKRQMADHTKRELASARAAHEQIQAHYDKLLREIESTQSELNVSHDYLRTLEKQLDVFQTEDESLTGLLHPIRQCPDEILALIFECTVDINEFERFKVATAVSHVCQTWRTVALRTSSLWKQIIISMDDSLDDMKEFLRRTKERLRSPQVWLRIKNIPAYSNATKVFMENLKINQFGHLERLHLHLEESKDLAQLKHSWFGISPAYVDVLFVDATSDSENSVIWDCAFLLRQSNVITVLQLNNLGEVVVGGEDALPSLLQLVINKTSVPTLALQLHRLSSLEVLEISGHKFEMEPLLQDIVMPMLFDLEIMDVMNMPWGRITAPCLIKIKTNDPDFGGDDVLNFFCRHPSLLDLNYDVWVDEAEISDLGKALTELHTLAIGGCIAGIFKEISGEVPFHPFPKLEELAIDDRKGQGVSQADFEEIVRARCLPQHSQTGSEDVTKLSTFKIITETDGVEYAPWRRSGLLDRCALTVSEWSHDNKVCTVEMKWGE